MPALSIITVVKDDPEGLESTVASIRIQGPADAELLVIDGSARPIAHDLSTPFPCRVIYEPPAGIYAAMNSGLVHATGRYAYFLNAGDTFANDRVLARILDGLREADSPEWAFGEVRFTDIRGRELRERPWDYQEERAHHFARGVFPAHQGIIVQISTLRELGGFDARYRIAADYALMLSLSRRADPIRWRWVIAEFQKGGASTQHWWLAQREFHQARREVLRPRGWSCLREQIHTAQTSLQALAGRAVASMRS